MVSHPLFGGFDVGMTNPRHLAARTIDAADLTSFGASELAEAIRSKQASSREVVEAHLRRIEAVNPSINALTVVLGDEALREPKEADDAVCRGDDLAPLHPSAQARSCSTSFSMAVKQPARAHWWDAAGRRSRSDGVVGRWPDDRRSRGPHRRGQGQHHEQS